MMRDRKTYRGARRNSYVTPAAKRTRFFGWNAWEQANIAAKLPERTQLANEAITVISKAYVDLGVMAASSARRADAATVALLQFYAKQTIVPHKRAISRIVRDLEASTRRAA